MQRLEFPILITVAVVVVWIAHTSDPDHGLVGASCGAAFGLALAFVSHLFTKDSASARGTAVVTAVLRGVVICFVSLLAAILVVRGLWPAYLKTFALSAVSVYVLHRLLAGMGANRRVS